jgi:hypothetical protein
VRWGEADARSHGGDSRSGRVETHEGTIDPRAFVREPLEQFFGRNIGRFFDNHAQKDRACGQAGLTRHAERREARFEGQLDLDPEL